MRRVPDVVQLDYPPEDFNSSVAWLEQVRDQICSEEREREALGVGLNLSKRSIMKQHRARLNLTSHDRPRIVVVTGGSGFRESEHGPAVANQRCYCAQHGYHYHHVQHDFTKGKNIHPMFNKMFSVVHAMASVPLGSWVFWVDRDVIFTNMSVPVSVTINDAKRFRPTPDTCQMVTDTSYCAGQVLFRSSCWTMKFISDWFDRRDHPPGCMYVAPQFDQIPFILTLLADATANDASIMYRAPVNKNTSLLYPNCKSWAGSMRLAHQIAWGGPARDRVQKLSHRAGSPLCPLPDGPDPWKHLQHFLGMKSHSNVRNCFARHNAQWRNVSGNASAHKLTRFCHSYAQLSAHYYPGPNCLLPAGKIIAEHMAER